MSIDGCSKRDLEWLSRAAWQARSNIGRSRHGAIVVKGGRVIGFGTNSSRTHNRWEIGRRRELCSIHAEVSALRRARSGIRATVYVARINRRGMYRGSAPCNHCCDYLSSMGVKRVVHT